MTTLRDETAALQLVDQELGDEITYTPEGGSPSTFDEWVAYGSEVVSAGASAGTASVKQIEVLMSVIAQPKKGDRITLSTRPGIIYQPAGWEEDVTGAKWVIPLKRVVS